VKEMNVYARFLATEPHLLRIIFSSDYSESSHSRTLLSRFHRGNLPRMDRTPTRSSALRFVSRFA